MLTFKQYLLEMSIPNVEDCLGKMRHAMPQLSNYDDFVEDLKSNKITMTTAVRKPADLCPTQKNFNEDKIEAIKKNASWTRSIPSVLQGKPIITSQDDYVIDGHHRWMAAHQLERHIECRVIGMDAEALLAFLKDKPYVEKKSINEQTGVK